MGGRARHRGTGLRPRSRRQSAGLPRTRSGRVVALLRRICPRTVQRGTRGHGTTQVSGVTPAWLADYARGVDKNLVANGDDGDRPLPREPYDLVAPVRVGVHGLVVKAEPLQLAFHPPAERAVVARVKPYTCLLERRIHGLPPVDEFAVTDILYPGRANSNLQASSDERTTSSTSTGASSGNSATPTAERACRPASPKTSPMSSDAPSSTPGWPLNPGAEATKPVTLTMLEIPLRPPAWAAAAARALSAHRWAAHRASSALTVSPTLPFRCSSPASKGSGPAVKIRPPARVAGT